MLSWTTALQNNIKVGRHHLNEIINEEIKTLDRRQLDGSKISDANSFSDNQNEELKGTPLNQ